MSTPGTALPGGDRSRAAGGDDRRRRVVRAHAPALAGAGLHRAALRGRRRGGRRRQRAAMAARQPLRRGAARRRDAGPRRAAPGRRAAPPAAAAGGGVRHRARRARVARVRTRGHRLPDQAGAARAPAGRAAAGRATAATACSQRRRGADAGGQRPRPRAAHPGHRGAVPEGRVEVRDAAHRRRRMGARRGAGRPRAAPGRRASSACTATRWWRGVRCAR